MLIPVSLCNPATSDEWYGTGQISVIIFYCEIVILSIVKWDREEQGGVEKSSLKRSKSKIVKRNRTKKNSKDKNRKEQIMNVNPITRLDYPDPDVIRVGDTYYMVSTTMHFMPGCEILQSFDLMHWEHVTYVYETLDHTDS